MTGSTPFFPLDKAVPDGIRAGYLETCGTWDGWRIAMTEMLGANAGMAFLVSLAAGSLLRDRLDAKQPLWVHLSGESSTGKTLAIKSMVSLRSSPENMVWCFDGIGALKTATVGATDAGFLCLDDAHLSMIPDNTRHANKVSDVYLRHMCGEVRDGSEPAVTLFTASDLRAVGFIRPISDDGSIEIDMRQTTLWPERDTRWWMDEYIPALYLNYGHAHDRICLWFDSLGDARKKYFDMKISECLFAAGFDFLLHENIVENTLRASSEKFCR